MEEVETWAVLASGPSMSQEVADSVKGLRVIAVSNTYQLAPWAEVLVSNDKTWWTNNPEAFSFEGEKFCGLSIEPPKGVTKFQGAMTGSNSALLALQIAVSKGAKRILLLGVDLQGSHYFGDHPAPLKNPQSRFPVFQKQFAAYHPKGVEIFNCSPESELKAYPFAEVKDFLPQPPPPPPEPGPAGPPGKDGVDGKDGRNGRDGKDGKDGKEGPMGVTPDHQWDGTRLRWENPDGSWDKYVDLRGPAGEQGAGGGGGGSQGMTPEQALQLNTLLAIFGGWIATAPVVDIASLIADDLHVTGTATATGFYSTIPGGAPVGAAYEWNWGDGASSSTVNASHTYAEAGTYTVSFRAKNHIGWSEWVSDDVTVSESTDTDPYWAQVRFLLQGDSLEDASGNQTVTVVGGSPSASGGFVQLPDGASLSIPQYFMGGIAYAGAWTIEGESSTSNVSGTSKVMFGNLSGNTREFQMSINGGGTGAAVYVFGPEISIGSTTPIANDEVIKWAVSYNPADDILHFYINGEVAESFPDAGIVSFNSTTYIGQRGPSFGSNFLNGKTRMRVTAADRYGGASYTPPTWPVPTSA